MDGGRTEALHGFFEQPGNVLFVGDVTFDSQDPIRAGALLLNLLELLCPAREEHNRPASFS